MKQPNQLLKIVSILYIVFGVISAAIVVAGSLGIGALLGGAAGDVGAGLAMTGFFALISLVGVALQIAAGVMGLKAVNLNACSILGIILIVLATISLISAIAGGGGLITALIGEVLPILYFIGVSNEKKERGI